MATKTWKIGERCIGGIITVTIKKEVVAVISKEWDMSAGTKKSSNQSNAKERDRLELDLQTTSAAYIELLHYIGQLTTSYYTDEIITWIRSKVPTV